MRAKRMSFLIAMMIAGGLFFAGVVQAKPEFFMNEKANQPGLTCKTCHVSTPAKGDADKKLNETGKYYQEHKKLPCTKK